ncbi:MAG: thiamine pyrophosphate-binding protein [Chloroflexi bacterium]|nr:thiamine pyrophosphate-binding protein [Chloroflexota bacterium]
MPYRAALAALERRRREEIVVTTMTSSRVWAHVTQRPELDLSFGGCMGKASSLGLGLALGQPDRRVWVLDGDGSLLMNLGTLVTIAQHAPANLTHFLLENGVYEVTGGQPVPGAGTVDFAAMARAAGYRAAFRFDALDALEAGLERALAAPGPTFVTLVVGPAGALPASPGGPTRPARSTRQALAELRALLATSA